MCEGSCLCGAVQWQLTGPLQAARFCHCSHCRKFSGAAAGAWAMASTADFSVSHGEDSVRRYNSGRGLRCFCGHCGSALWFESIEHPQLVSIALGSLDGGDIPAPEMHIFTGARPAWSAIADQLPQHADYPTD